MNNIKLMRHCVINTATGAKVPVTYSHGKLINRPLDCVTIYAKSYSGDLSLVFPASGKNNSDMMTDYYEKDSVSIFANHPLFAQALAVVAANEAAEEETEEKRDVE